MCFYTQKFLCEDDCEQCYNRSFASHEMADCWDYEKNNGKTPRQVFKSTNTKYWFICACCKHPFDSALNNIVAGKRCPYCCQASKKLCEDDNCIPCRNRSFASCDKAKHWSDKNKVTPRQVSKNSHRVCWFKCDCGHEFEAALYNVSKGKWCPYCCTPPQKLCKDDNCISCRDKSFASHPYAQYWSDKNDCTPREVFKGSERMCWFKCAHGHEFEVHLYTITGGSGCPQCYYKTEVKLAVWLEKHGYLYTRQIKFKWCKKNRLLIFDFLIDELGIIIELDGRQHFEQVWNWNSYEETYENDLFKTTKVLENGYSIIRILQEDVLYNRNDWEGKLTKCLRTYSKPSCIFIDNNDKYGKLRSGLKKVRKLEDIDCKIRHCHYN